MDSVTLAILFVALLGFYVWWINGGPDKKPPLEPPRKPKPTWIPPTGEPESVLELELLGLLRRRGFAEPVPQYRVSIPFYANFRLDFAYPEIKLALEADGAEWHGSLEAQTRDRERDDLLKEEGWRTVRLTWGDVVVAPSQALAKLEQAGVPRRAATLDDRDDGLPF